MHDDGDEVEEHHLGRTERDVGELELVLDLLEEAPVLGEALGEGHRPLEERTLGEALGLTLGSGAAGGRVGVVREHGVEARALADDELHDHVDRHTERQAEEQQAAEEGGGVAEERRAAGAREDLRLQVLGAGGHATRRERGTLGGAAHVELERVPTGLGVRAVGGDVLVAQCRGHLVEGLRDAGGQRRDEQPAARGPDQGREAALVELVLLGDADGEHRAGAVDRVAAGRSCRGVRGVVAAVGDQDHVVLERGRTGEQGGGRGHAVPHGGVRLGVTVDRVDLLVELGGVVGEALHDLGREAEGHEAHLVAGRLAVDELVHLLLGGLEATVGDHRAGDVDGEDQRAVHAGGAQELRGRGADLRTVLAERELLEVGGCTVVGEVDRDGGRVGRVDLVDLELVGALLGRLVGDAPVGLGERARRDARDDHGAQRQGRSQSTQPAHLAPTARRVNCSGWNTSAPRRIPRSASFSANLGRTPVALRWPRKRPCSSMPMP